MIENLKKIIAHELVHLTELSESQIINLLEIPKQLEHGHLAFPVFMLAKTLKKAPPVIAQDIAARLKSVEIESALPAGGYVNIVFKNNVIQKEIQNSLSQDRIGFQRQNNETVVIDYSSPNVAKPMSIGHLRATVIGQAVRNLAETQGYKVIGLNYLGDWGVQFGKLAYAYTEWPGRKLKDYDFSKNPFEALFQLYVDFHQACELDPELDKKGSLTFKSLEQGEPEVTKLWRMFLDISLKEYERIYGLLNVKFDLIQGESFYNDKMEAAVDRLKAAGILEDSDGAKVVFINDKMPPCIIKKSDGASLYATRDIASAIHRHEVMKADHLLYVVGVDQSLHFQQVYGVLEKLEYPWAKNCHHIAFGMYRFKDEGKMSTRRGRVIFMDDVLNRSIELAKDIIEAKNPNLEDKEKIATQVGVGAIIFNDLAFDRVKNVDFDWDQVLNFEGDSGPHVQYCTVRCKGILRKFGKTLPTGFSQELVEKEERALLRELLNYPEVLKNSYKNFKPSILTQYLLDLCKAFGSFYQNNKILDEKLDENLILSRIYLVHCTQRVLEEGLQVLGIPTPDRM